MAIDIPPTTPAPPSPDATTPGSYNTVRLQALLVRQKEKYFHLSSKDKEVLFFSNENTEGKTEKKNMQQKVDFIKLCKMGSLLK